MYKIIVNKSLRSIWKNKKSYFSGIIVLIIGLGMFIGMLSGYLTYMESVRLYYSETNFADVFVTVKAMPSVSVDRLTKIDGVNQSQGVLTHITKASLDGVDDLIGVMLVGVDEKRPMLINQFRYTGEPLSTSNDILVSNDFYDVHSLNVGDTIRILINGQYEVFTIRGTVVSPEYPFVPEIGGSSDASLNTVGFVQSGVVEANSGMFGAVNNIRLILDDSTTFEDIKPDLNAEMERYGIIDLVSRENHMSYVAIISQSSTFIIMATLFPIMLLGIAICMLYVTLRRLVTMERVEIGTLKAMGFSNRNILSGYMSQGVLAAIISFAPSVFFAWIVGTANYNVIANEWDLPLQPYVLNTAIIIVGLFIALFTGLFGVIMGAKSSLGIEPAEAMRAAPPSTGSVGNKFNGLFSRLLLDIGGQIAIRSMRRNKRRVLITIISIAAIFSIMNIFFTMGQLVLTLADDLFYKAQISDCTIVLDSIKPSDALIKDIRRAVGVLEVETVLTISVELENNGLTRSLDITGLDANASLFNIFDNNGSRIRTNSGGLILSRFFADELGLTVGQCVSVNHPNLHSPADVEVTQIIESSIGEAAYMEISELSMLFGDETVANMVMVNVEQGYLPILFDQLNDVGSIVTLSDNERAHASARVNADMNNAIFNIINIVSIIICFAIIYNLSSIALGEKQREYATLRVLGFQAPAVNEINTFEYIVMLIIGSVIGVGFSYLLIPQFGIMFSFEHEIISAKLAPMPTLLTFMGVTLAVLGSCFLTGRQIRKFNLVEVLKER